METSTLKPLISDIDCIHPKPGETVVVKVAQRDGVTYRHRDTMDRLADALSHAFPNNKVVVIPEGMELTIEAGESEAPKSC
jgi:hypothetical protein